MALFGTKETIRGLVSLNWNQRTEVLATVSELAFQSCEIAVFVSLSHLIIASFSLAPAASQTV